MARQHSPWLALSWLLLMAAGCMPGAQPRPSYVARPQPSTYAFDVFHDTASPLSYQAPVGRDVGKPVSSQRVRGRACQHGLQLPIAPLIALFGGSAPGAPSLAAAWGEGAYREAIADARRGLPQAAVLYDVRADINTMLVLSIYRRECLIVDAAVGRRSEPSAQPAAAPATPDP